MLYSSFKAAGLTDPETGLQKDKNGGLKASQKDVLDAVQLLTEAGSNKEFRSSRLYVEAVSTVLPKLENSSAKVQSITKDMQDATVAGQKGNKVEQERLLKHAVSQADQTNTAAIAQMLRDPMFVASQRSQQWCMIWQIMLSCRAPHVCNTHNFWRIRADLVTPRAWS